MAAVFVNPMSSPMLSLTSSRRPRCISGAGEPDPIAAGEVAHRLGRGRLLDDEVLRRQAGNEVPFVVRDRHADIDEVDPGAEGRRLLASPSPY